MFLDGGDTVEDDTHSERQASSRTSENYWESMRFHGKWSLCVTKNVSLYALTKKQFEPSCRKVWSIKKCVLNVVPHTVTHE